MRITKAWDWNPIRWSWYSYDMNVRVLVNGAPECRIMRFKGRGPYQSTTVLA